MDNYFVRLPSVLLEDIHRRIVDTGGVGSAMAFEATCKEISLACRNIRLRRVVVARLRNGIAQFLNWNRAHGDRVDSLLLALNRLTPCCTPIRDYDIGGNEIHLTIHIASTLAPLASVPRVTSLYIERLSASVCVPLCPLATLAPTLRTLSLNISPGTVPSLLPLADLTALTFLELRNLVICRTLNILASLPPSLCRLQLVNAPHILDLFPLANCVGLTHLTLEDFPHLQSLAPLPSLTRLRRLRLIKVASTTDLQPLHFALLSLTSLELRTCEVPALEQLTTIGSGKLQALKLLDCNYLHTLNPLAPLTPVGPLTPLSALTTLTTLDLLALRPSAHDLRFLSPLAALRFLRVSCSRYLADLTPLTPLTHLTHLELHGARAATCLAPLASLTALQILHLGHCRAPSLAPLTALTHLRQLRCKSLRNVSSLEPLRKLPCLHKLNITDCPLVESQAATLEQAFMHACTCS